MVQWKAHPHEEMAAHDGAWPAQRLPVCGLLSRRTVSSQHALRQINTSNFSCRETASPRPATARQAWGRLA